MLVREKTLSFIDEWVVKDIMKKYGLSDKEALEKYMFSQTYQMVNDYETGLYLMSPEAVFDIWECEQTTGSPRNSVYM